jgi:predicted nucleotidyltransferase
MLLKLFGSEARVKILELFTLNAGSEFYLREIAQRTGLAVRSVQRTVKDLSDIGILDREARGNSVYFRLNAVNPITPDLKAIFLKTVGLADLILEALAGESQIEAAFVFGSVAKGDEAASSDIDVAIIGEIPSRRLTDIVTNLERQTRREVNITTFARAEWGERISTGDHFVTTLLREPKIMLVGHEKELKMLGRRIES